ncbi:MAG: hypothetical protein JHC71_15530, partial [Blastococcus sp.]|nr:hypothetical protein [Blastococcus sp.]
MTEFTAGITQGTRPASITAGPDGAMWFTQSDNPTSSPVQPARIGRISMDGVVTEFPVPSYPNEITAGPDGNLWYTVRSGAIGRMSTAGV